MHRRGFISGLSMLAAAPIVASVLPRVESAAPIKDVAQVLTVRVRVDNDFVVKAFLDDYNKNGKTRQTIEQGTR